MNYYDYHTPESNNAINSDLVPIPRQTTASRSCQHGSVALAGKPVPNGPAGPTAATGCLALKREEEYHSLGSVTGFQIPHLWNGDKISAVKGCCAD